ncbi:hypothetical protein DT076_05690 [Desertihabitans brevis]|uniref:Uncharacterized protein n=1 Tax=Desertihabitans brevis TaxID=2268447 RepID=A0A367YWH1_9ACTN|nr:hypothetical protein [Desertihabitans brevis]RCK70168.1 hypothetical protein DT076_05690 [Desertihabitans brevis]
MLLDRFLRKPTAKEATPPPISATHPSSYADQVELALIAAVFTTATATDPACEPDEIRRAVDRWHLHRACRADKLTHITGLDDYAFARVMRNPCHLGGRPRTCVVQDAADALIAVGLLTSTDVAQHREEARSQLLQVRGVDESTVGHFFDALELPAVPHATVS